MQKKQTTNEDLHVVKHREKRPKTIQDKRYQTRNSKNCLKLQGNEMMWNDK